MSKEKAREFLARLKALEAEFDARATVEGWDMCDHWVDIGGESYKITDDYEFWDDVEERAVRSLQADIATDPLAYVAVEPPRVDYFQRIIEKHISDTHEAVTAHATAVLKMYDDRKHGIITNIPDE